MGDLQSAKWVDVLEKALKKNYSSSTDAPVVVQLASVTSQGLPKIQPFVWHSFLDADKRVLLFSGATRNAELMGVVKHSNSHQIHWQMPTSKDTFTLSGRLYIVAAPTMSHRFGTPPRRIFVGEGVDSDEFWEQQRLKAWKAIGPTYRATFTWPAPGEPKNPSIRESWSAYRDPVIKAPPPTIDTGYSYTKLNALKDEASKSVSPTPQMATLPRSVGSPTMAFSTGSLGRPAERKMVDRSSMDKEEELRFVHNSAMDNFTLIVFKCMMVDHWTPGNPIPSRTVHTSDKSGFWSVEELNP
ncbi:hypothetical protein BJ742DRAFT_421079 [Cladochytrium replicatum]|nr:hypothetical protein BJ742DRAFT_421079 [Cladochytrium replicatum]